MFEWEKELYNQLLDILNSIQWKRDTPDHWIGLLMTRPNILLDLVLKYLMRWVTKAGIVLLSLISYGE